MRLRTDVREWLSGWSVLGNIHDLFRAEGFHVVDHGLQIGGERRSLVEGFYASADWSQEEARARFLRVCEGIVNDPREDAQVSVETMRRKLQREGFEIDELGRIRRPGEALSAVLVSQLSDESAIRLHLARIQDAVDDRPEEVIGAAKDLIEATVKHVLLQVGEPIPPNASLPELTRLAQRSLLLHPEVLAPTRPGAETIKKILGALSTIATGTAELRNLYGTGHGQAVRTAGLHTRHARLTALVAQAYVTFLLETLSDPRAPWRHAQESSKATSA
jgi:phage gp36-like protein